MSNKKNEIKNIGLNVKSPKDTCSDKNCPFHGKLSIRGQVITGIISSLKMQNTVLVKKEFTHLVPKYERYEKRTSTYSAHCPPCLKIKLGDRVRTKIRFGAIPANEDGHVVYMNCYGTTGICFNHKFEEGHNLQFANEPHGRCPHKRGWFLSISLLEKVGDK